jgi:hypothetical protein
MKIKNEPLRQGFYPVYDKKIGFPVHKNSNLFSE